MLDERVRAELEAEPVIERRFEDPARGYRGYVVIDSLCHGHANGGVRIRPGLTLGELRDAARVMTWKHRFAGIPNGGAKAGIEGDETLSRNEKARRLSWLADAAREWIDGGVLGIGPDLGTDPALIEGLLAQRALLLGRRRFPRRFRGSGYYTALTVVESAAVALGACGERLRGARVAIEGFGAVGSSAARLAAERGARVVAVSTRDGGVHREGGLDVAALCRSPSPLAGDPRARRLAPAELLTLPVDCLLPCGPGGTIDVAVARAVRARTVVPGANHAASLEAAQALHARGILLVPCFVANCGGVTAASLRMGSVPEAAVERLLRRLFPGKVARLLAEARQRRCSPLECALATLPPFPDRSPRRALSRLGSPLRRMFRSPYLPGLLWALPTYLYVARRLGARLERPVGEQSGDGARRHA